MNQCSRCVMDTSAKNIVFNEQGECNFCSDFMKKISIHNAIGNNELRLFAEKVKRDGKGKPYDCIVGVSGGVDSSYSLYLAKSVGLRPLAVHMDNGFNSELAVNNIANLVEKLGVDLYTHVINWDEYRDMLLAFLKAGVIDLELLYDNAMLAVNYSQASKYGIKYILSGSNSSTEGIAMPNGWNWFKFDAKNIRSIHSEFGTVKSKTFPYFSVLKYNYYKFVKKIEWISFLDFVDYNKNEAMAFLQKEFAFKPYPYKHYESIFTRFYQGYILPNKFGIDKRKLHFSTLICTGQMNRDEALEKLRGIAYPSEIDLKTDMDFVCKKLGLSAQDFEKYMSSNIKQHDCYGTEQGLYFAIGKIIKKMKI
ncbi:MAG: N-acetyl sugar amidotransferase [Campylobacterales bacterium]